jgi:hypothetical protein
MDILSRIRQQHGEGILDQLFHKVSFNSQDKQDWFTSSEFDSLVNDQISLGKASSVIEAFQRELQLKLKTRRYQMDANKKRIPDYFIAELLFHS